MNWRQEVDLDEIVEESLPNAQQGTHRRKLTMQTPVVTLEGPGTISSMSSDDFIDVTEEPDHSPQTVEI